MPQTQEAAMFAESNPDASTVMGDTNTPNGSKNSDTQDEQHVEREGEQKVEQPEPSSDMEAEPVEKPHAIDNPDAIPTAGGVKVGQQHYGESQKENEYAGRREEQKQDGEEHEEEGNGTRQSGGTKEKEGIGEKVKDVLHLHKHKGG